MSDGDGSKVGGKKSGNDACKRYAPRQWIYQNLTPWRIHACFTAGGALLDRTRAQGSAGGVVKVLSIPALGEITMPHEDARDLDTLDMRRLGQLEVRPAPNELLTNLPRAIAILGWLGVGLFFGAWALFFGGGSALPWAWCVAAVVIVPVTALIAAMVREIHLYQRFNRYRRASCRSLEGVQPASRIRTFIDGVPRQAAEVAVLIGAVLVSVIGLGMAIHLTTQLKDLLPVDYGAILRLDNPFADVNELARSSPAFWQLLVGHVAQWVLVSVAALVPAAMYFQFDRQRLASMQRRWVQEVFRLDPTVRTIREIEAKYGSQIEASFGDLSSDSGLRLRSGRRSPVIVATILLVVGWFLLISATQVPNLVEVSIDGVPSTNSGVQGTELVWPSPQGSNEVATIGDSAGTDVAAVADDGPFPVSTFFRPQLSLIGYAFLGAYVFTLFHVLRGYQRRDLHPKTYNTIVVRILAAYALSLVASVVYDGPAADVLLFFVGFTPQSALVWLREKLSQDERIWKRLPLHEPAPLTELEGIDLYDRTRLAEEGINNVEALAHADIVDLMSSTRISAAELVDWTDQAILYLRVGGDALARHAGGVRPGTGAQPTTSAAASNTEQPDHAAPDGAGAGSEPGSQVASAPATGTHAPPDVHRNLWHLRSFGIRTATDLLQVYEQALRRGGENAASRAAEVELLRSALELPDAPRGTSVRTIQTIIDTLPDEEWFVQIRNWRNSEFGAVDAWYQYLDGHDWNLTPTSDTPRRVRHAMRPFESVPMIHPSPPPDVTSSDRSSAVHPGLRLRSPRRWPRESNQL